MFKIILIKNIIRHTINAIYTYRNNTKNNIFTLLNSKITSQCFPFATQLTQYIFAEITPKNNIFTLLNSKITSQQVFLVFLNHISLCIISDILRLYHLNSSLVSIYHSAQTTRKITDRSMILKQHVNKNETKIPLHRNEIFNLSAYSVVITLPIFLFSTHLSKFESIAYQ